MATKADLQNTIEDLKARLEEEHRLRILAESGIESSRPYILLSRKYEELQTAYNDLKATLEELRTPKREAASPRNPARGRPRSIDEDTRDKVMILHQEGDSIRTISKTLGISVGSVQNIVHKNKSEI